MSHLTAGGSRRRKACDLCFTKKIKCDLRLPQCSNCAIYKTACRRSHSRHMAEAPLGGSRTRIARRRHQTVNMDRIVVESPPQTDSNDETEPLWRFDPVSPRLYNGPADGLMTIPPLEEVMPVVDHYFQSVNPAMPVFNQGAFMRMMAGWLNRGNKQSDVASWAAILVVIALGLQVSPDTNHPHHHHHHHDAPQPSFPSPSRRRHLTDWCLRNALSTVPDLSVHADNLTGIQALTGMAVLFRNSVDARTAAVLLGLAVRLMHQMHVNCISSAEFFSGEELSERSNVLWVAYIIDKHISVQTKTPSLLSDHNISIPMPMPTLLPSATSYPENSSSSSSSISSNIFSHRVHLAHIAGQIYDRLYSSYALSLSTPERHLRVSELEDRLDSWKKQSSLSHSSSSSSPPFSLSHLSDDNKNPIDSSPQFIIEQTHTHHFYLLCLSTVHGIWSTQPGSIWDELLSSLGRAALHDFSSAVYGTRVATCIRTHLPTRTVRAWKDLTEAARQAAGLLKACLGGGGGGGDERKGGGAEKNEGLVMRSFCPHLSGLVVLLAGIIDPGRRGEEGDGIDERRSDFALVRDSLEIYDGHFDGLGGWPAYQSLRMVIDDLRKRAAGVLEEYSSRAIGAGGSPGEGGAAAGGEGRGTDDNISLVTDGGVQDGTIFAWGPDETYGILGYDSLTALEMVEGEFADHVLLGGI